MLQIAILLHRYDAFERADYWLRAIAEDWRDRGIGVELLYGPQARADADLAILHFDLTTIPAEYLDHISGYRRVINGGVGDISKRRISANLLRRADPHAPGSFYGEGRAAKGGSYDGLLVDTIARSVAALSLAGQIDRPGYVEYNIVNPHGDVGIDDFAAWVRSAGYRVQRVTTMAPGTRPSRAGWAR
jgi:hypothetical protein